MPVARKPARLWLRPARGTRQAVWIIKDNGRQTATGCGPADLAGAQQALERYLAASRQPERQQLANPADLPIADALTVYMRDQTTATRPKELAYRVNALLDYFGTLTLAGINAASSKAYAEQRGSASSARRELEDLSAAISWCQKLDMLPAGWRANIVLPPKSKPRLRWLTRDEAARLIWAAWRYREVQKGKATDRASRQHVARFILVGLYTGTRSGAICGAALTNAIGRGYVDLENGQFYRRGLGDAETNKRQPTIRIPERLLAHMRRWQRQRLSNSAVIEYEGRPVHSVKKAFARAVTDAKLAAVSPHTLRHTAVSWAVQAGVDIYRVANFFGLTVRVIETVYGHLAPDNVVGDAITRRVRATASIGGGPPVDHRKDATKRERLPANVAGSA